jgi:polar amino acid transport system permease protein
MFFNMEIMSKGSPFQTGTSLSGSNWAMMARGMWVAIKIFLISAIFSTLLGLVIAVVRSIINDKVLNFFLIAYVDIMRSIPILVMLIVVYSLLPYAGILLSPNVSGILTLVMVQGAYMSEVFRAGIEAIHKQQIEASLTLGLTPFKTMRYVVLPQALRIIIPPYTGYLVGLMKGTALCSQIAIFELLKSAYQIQSWYINATPLMIASGFYLVFLIPLTRLSNILEVKWKSNGSRKG